MKSAKGISKGQPVSPEKLSIAKHLRRTMTHEERRFWSAVRNNRLDGLHFRRQQIILGFIVDFYCEAASLVVELDGASHQLSVEQDAARDLELSGLGIKVIRIPNSQLRDDPETVLTSIILEARNRIVRRANP